MSHYRADSEVNLVAAALMKSARVPVSTDLMAVLVRSRAMWEASNGKFDVTIGPLSRLWREARKSGKLPESEKLKEALALVGFGHLQLDPESDTIELAAGRPVPEFDFGAIGKGYAADEALRVMRDAGFPAALVELGGDLACGAPPPGRGGWRIALSAIDREEKESGGEMMMVELANCGIATSGDRHQFMEVDGVRYSHLIDPHTGQPLTCSRLVTVIAPSGADADALATIFSLTPPEEAIPKAESLEGVSVHVEEMDGAGNRRSFSSSRFPEKKPAGD
jgi:FAD:protein FMN transferase